MSQVVIDAVPEDSAAPKTQQELQDAYEESLIVPKSLLNGVKEACLAANAIHAPPDFEIDFRAAVSQAALICGGFWQDHNTYDSGDSTARNLYCALLNKFRVDLVRVRETLVNCTGAEVHDTCWVRFCNAVDKLHSSNIEFLRCALQEVHATTDSLVQPLADIASAIEDGAKNAHNLSFLDDIHGALYEMNQSLSSIDTDFFNSTQTTLSRNRPSK